MIWTLSSDWFSGDGTGRFLIPLLERIFPWLEPASIHALHAGVRKLGHVTEYAILAVLVLRALDRPGRPVLQSGLIALALCAGYAVADELRQSFSATRVGAASDVALDTLGAALGVIATMVGRRGFSSDRRSRA